MVMWLAFKKKNGNMSTLSSQLLPMWHIIKLDRQSNEKLVSNASLVKYMFLMTCQFIIGLLICTLELFNKIN